LTTVVKVTSDVRPNTHHRHEVTEAELAKRKRLNSIAITLLCYPIAYLCLTMPVEIVRVAAYCGATFPIPVSDVVVCIYASSGWVNVLLYTIPRKGIISWDHILWWRKKETLTSSRKAHDAGHRRSTSDTRAIVPERFSVPRSAPSDRDSDSTDTKFETQHISSTDLPALPWKAKLNN